MIIELILNNGYKTETFGWSTLFADEIKHPEKPKQINLT